MDAVLEIAYDFGSRPDVVANLHGLSVNWVKVMRQVTAAAYLHQQNLGLGQLVKAADRQKPTFVITRLAFDETGEKLTVPVPGSDDARNTWHIFVARLAVHVGWRGTPVGDVVVKHDVVLPNLILASPSAPQIFANLFGHNAYTAAFAALDLLRSFAEHAVSIMEVDGASANEMLWAHLVDLNKHKSVLDSR